MSLDLATNGVRDSVWDGVVGQPTAVRRLTASADNPLHAYLFVGPAGSTKNEASRAFAGLLLAGVDDPHQRDARLALAGQHPDVREFARVGAAISKDQADEIIRLAALAPNESNRKVLILDEFHLLSPEAAAKLLKTIEEPPASTVFVILADFMPPDLVTIASRCIRIDFQPILDEVIVDVLVGEGTDPERAAEAAAAARGDLTRARLLANDTHLAARRAMFADAPKRLDGTGSAVMAVVDELLAEIEAAAAPLASRHEAEVVALEERIKSLGERGSGKKTLEERHKRELRRHRVDELRAGLATLAGSYRDALVAGTLPRPEAASTAITRIHKALEALDRNPNEQLLLQALLLELPSLPA
ncbi:MAG: holB [Acidimicrobiales bacterium]|nr:holB [Acidimicrobiales bacterium]